MTRHSSLSHKVDVAIIGAGPAGLSTALHLLQLEPGWSERLIVLEKDAHPRKKLCGGGITCFGLNRLRALGLPLGVPFVPVRSANLRYRNLNLKIKGDPVFVVTRRSDFDSWLAQCARARGVNLVENSKVTRLEMCDDGIQIYTPDLTCLAKVVVGADGSRGFVRSWLGAREQPAHVARVLETIKLASGNEKPFTGQEANFNFDHLDSDLQGYFWVFPSIRNNQPILNTGVYDARVAGGGPKADLTKILEEELNEIEIDIHSTRVEGHPIHWFSPQNRFSGHRVILAGDAAGTDPLFGEGISVSLAYGAVAAKNLERAFRENDFKFHKYKTSILTSDVGRYLLLRWFIASLVFRIQRSDILVRGIWGLGRLLAPFIYPSSPLMDVSSFHFAPAQQMKELMID